MPELQLIAIVITLGAIMAYLNERFLKLPVTISLMAMSLVLSVLVLLTGRSVVGEWLKHLIEGINFSTFVLDFMLGFLLFAGGLHTDVNRLRKARWPIITYATIGVLLSTTIIGFALYYLLPLIYQPIPFIYCLLFGALISPTDPIAVLSILRRAGVARDVETQIMGESLFNDGIGVVLFLTISTIARLGVEEIEPSAVAILLAKEVAGGLLLGWALGYLAFLMIRRIDHYQTEVLITIAVVAGGSVVASHFHFSAALAMVVAGLFIGNRGSREAMSTETQDYVHKFWELVDDVMNAVLFVLIGLELVVIPMESTFFVVGFIAIVLVLAARFISLTIPYKLFRFRYGSLASTLGIMTWGGLRGGISIALALSLSTHMHRELIVTVTYMIVLFSILVQGLTLEKVVRRLSE